MLYGASFFFSASPILFEVSLASSPPWLLFASCQIVSIRGGRWGCSGCPWRWAGWSILGGVMWDWWDGVVRICRGATGVYCGGPFLEKMEGYSGGQVWPMMGWQVVFESILKSEWQQQKEAVLDCVVKGFRCYWVPLHLLFSNPLIKVLINSV